MHPCIGVSCHPDYTFEKNQEQFGAYLQAIEDAGGEARLIDSFETFSHVRTHLDGLLIPGGCDVQPSLYHEEPHPQLGVLSPARDRLELEMIRSALRADLPILGICRGMQVLNVALGGTLYQDLATQLPESQQHQVPDEPEQRHRVRVLAGSRMAEIVGASEFRVNSRHHQALKDPGQGVTFCGWSDDGVVEMCEVAGYRLVIGMQCHPENIYTEIPACARLFSALVTESARCVSSTFA